MKNIDLKLIEKLAENMNDNSLTEISLELGEQKLVLKKEKARREVITTSAPQRIGRKNEVINEKNDVPVEKITGNIITSPMMGTFYRSPSPEANPFVEEGQSVENGMTVCIIEAMKMMNEVNSEFSGKIVRALVQDGAIVQKGEKLFIVE